MRTKMEQNTIVDALDIIPPLDQGKLSMSNETNDLSYGQGIEYRPSQINQGLTEHRPLWAKPVKQWREDYAQREHGSVELWGPLLLKGALTLLVGQSSVGKSVLVYRLAESLTTGQSFLGLTPSRPLRVLHIDLETPDDVRDTHLEVMENPEGWDIVDRHPPAGGLAEAARLYDVVIIDSLQVYAPVNDEDSNSEANRQMTVLVDIARESNAALLVTHNAGKVDAESCHSRFLSRGASARIDRADIAINYYQPPRPKTAEARELYVAKSRNGYNDSIMSFTLAGKGEFDYTLVEGLTLHVSKQAALLQRVRELLVDGQIRQRYDIRDTLGIEKDTAQDKLLTRALNQALKLKVLSSTGSGDYSLVHKAMDSLDMNKNICPSSKKPIDEALDIFPGCKGGKVSTLMNEVRNMPIRKSQTYIRVVPSSKTPPWAHKGR
jgi:hypothetical protein